MKSRNNNQYNVNKVINIIYLLSPLIIKGIGIFHFLIRDLRFLQSFIHINELLKGQSLQFLFIMALYPFNFIPLLFLIL
jgi:hypothetical protein